MSILYKTKKYQDLVRNKNYHEGELSYYKNQQAQQKQKNLVDIRSGWHQKMHDLDKNIGWEAKDCVECFEIVHFGDNKCRTCENIVILTTIVNRIEKKMQNFTTVFLQELIKAIK